jgi:hypothetical protein
MVPPAPGLFSTITVWPSTSRIGWAIARASWSVVPPAGYGTTMRITREGNASPCWLKAGSPTEAAAPPAASILSALRRVCRVMVVSWL